MIFLLAFSTSRHTVFLEIFILLPASTKEQFSKSTSLKASISAASKTMGGSFVGGRGVKPCTGGAKFIITGFGGLPLFPLRVLMIHLRLRGIIM